MFDTNKQYRYKTISWNNIYTHTHTSENKIKQDSVPIECDRLQTKAAGDTAEEQQ